MVAAELFRGVGESGRSVTPPRGVQHAAWGSDAPGEQRAENSTSRSYISLSSTQQELFTAHAAD